MLALITAFVLFLFLTLLGRAALTTFRAGALRTWLLAPSCGLAVIMIAVMFLNQAGLPVRSFALAVAVVLLAAGCSVLFWRRPAFPGKYLSPFFVVLGFALVYNGWQALLYGFNWTGYGNADAMAYCESASRLIDHGFFDVPTLAEILGRDFTQNSWFQFAPGMYRCGFDLFLAWTASVTRMNPFAIYMPVMLCLGLIQISAAAALVMTATRFRKYALLTALLLSMSPLFGFSVIAQVGPQVAGLALMLALCAITLRDTSGGWRIAIGDGAIIALIGTSLAVCYPEALPFWAVSYVGFQIASVLRGRHNLTFQLRIAAVSLALTIILARENLLRAYFALVFAVGFSQASPKIATPTYSGFEVFKMPHGPAALFGLVHYQSLPGTVWLSTVIVAGFCLLAVCLWKSVRDAACLMPYAFVFLTMALAGILLLRSPMAFGSFKMGLYIQPLLMAAMARYCWSLRRAWPKLLVVSYGLASFFPHTQTIRETTGALFGLSSAGINLPGVSNGLSFQVNSPTNVPATLISLYIKGVPTDRINGRFLPTIRWVDTYTKPLLGPLLPNTKLVAESDDLADRTEAAFVRRTSLGFHFMRRRNGETASHINLLSLGRHGDYFNHTGDNRMSYGAGFFACRSLEDVRNYLAFVNSAEAHDYYSPNSNGATSYYGFEEDLYQPNQDFYGAGRYFFFEVINPSQTVRLRVSLTRSLMGSGRTLLPAGAVALGDHQASLRLAGAGAASVFSEALRPVFQDGHYYLALDFRDDAISPPNPKAGLMRLYGEEIPIDVRKIIGYVRDISVVSEEEYQNLDRPKSVLRWPEDLFRGPGLEFSGFYEDGWASDHALMNLGPSKPGEQLVINGMVPGIGKLYGKGNVLRVSIGGELAATKSLRPGAFEVAVPIRQLAKMTAVNLEFSAQERLPGGDDRPIAAQIRSIAIR
jgi:hypothetical protein